MLGAPALATAQGTLVVVVVQGPAVGVVTLPANARVEFLGATYDTDSPYTVVTATQGAKYLGYVGRFPGDHYTGTIYTQPKGGVTLRVLTSGRTTVTFPATGFSGRRVVNLRSRLRGATATSRPADVVVNNARQVLPFTTVARSHVFQGFHTPRPVGDEAIYTFCLSPRGEACPDPAAHLWRGPASGTSMTHEQAPGGAYDSHLTLVLRGVIQHPVTHYVLTVPVA